MFKTTRIMIMMFAMFTLGAWHAVRAMNGLEDDKKNVWDVQTVFAWGFKDNGNVALIEHKTAGCDLVNSGVNVYEIEVGLDGSLTVLKVYAFPDSTQQIDCDGRRRIEYMNSNDPNRRLSVSYIPGGMGTASVTGPGSFSNDLAFLESFWFHIIGDGTGWPFA